MHVVVASSLAGLRRQSDVDRRSLHALEAHEVLGGSPLVIGLETAAWNLILSNGRTPYVRTIRCGVQRRDSWRISGPLDASGSSGNS